MCGIVGIASRRQIESKRSLAISRRAMRHRGPDDEGEWWSPDGRVGFGHQRLAIIDLSPNGHQPMQDAVGELCIVFNGEIYNFHGLRSELAAKGFEFRSQSDTEVVLAAYRQWGTECLSRLNGMFAFALYDKRQEQVLMARDRAGEKPLFYQLAGHAIRFASELKGLMVGGNLPRIDRDSLDCYLAEGFVPGDRCILEGVRKLPPAHALSFSVDSAQVRIWRYWQLPTFDVAGSIHVDEENLADELDVLLENSVRQRLVADVPVGILLSGGVDSSLVTAMAARASPKLRTFTVRFPGHGKLDETEHARLVARHFDTEHVELEAETINVDILPMLARQFDEPIIDSSMIPTYLVSHMIREYCTVALGGDGGDELFGGYSHYNRLLWMRNAFGWMPGFVRRAAGRVAGIVLPVGFKGRNWLQGLSIDFRRGVPLIATYFDYGTRRRLMNRHDNWSLVAERIRDHRLPATGDLLQRATRADFEAYLADDILVKVDRASMLTSLEVRAPMLDVSVIEFAFGKVPSHLKATAGARKILLKKLASRVLPREFDRHRKQGFSIPLSSWLQSGKWSKYFRDVLFNDSQTMFDHASIKMLFDGLSKGYANGERLFGLLMFELWRREYGASI